MIEGVNGIHHVAISVPSLKAAEDFYVNKLGMEKIVRWDFDASEIGDSVTDLKDASAKTLMIKAGNLYLEVFEFTSPTAKPQGLMRPVCDHGYTHIAFDVDESCIRRVYDEWEKAGVRWHHPITADTDEGVTMTYGRDPFGNVIEIQALAENVEFHANRLEGIR
jgi:YD repeat-containing protein